MTAKNWSGFLRVFLYLLITVFALILVTLVRPHTSDGFIYQLGKNCALVAFIILALQVVLGARIKWIERPFGLDMIFRYHKAAGVIALCLIILHVTLVCWGSGHWYLLTSLHVSWPVWLGRLALLALVTTVVTSLWRYKLKIEFESWRRLHNALFIVILAFGFIHGFKIGGDLTAPAMRIYWLAALAAAVTVYLFHKAMRPRHLKRHAYTVTAVHREAPRIWTIQLAPPDGQSAYSYAPGQFQYITFRRGRGLPVEEHHWTISSTPTRPGIASTIKELGDFTSSIGQTRVGDKADVDGPYGHFSYVFYPEEDDLLFIAGGIGITPFLAMLRHMHDTGVHKRVLLLWSNRTEEELLAREEIGQIGKFGTPELKVVFFLTNAGEEWKGERGRIDKDAIVRYLEPADGATRGAYVCCPTVMAKAIIRALEELGMPAEHIHHEGFSL
jgi:predicted ferric reductase